MKLFLSAGAMKAGTTWLYSLLNKHPDLYFTPEKEIHFLNHHYVNQQVLREEFRIRQAKARLSSDNIKHIGVYRMLARWYAMYLEIPSDYAWYRRIFSLNRTDRYNCDFSNLSCHLEESHWKDVKSICDEIKVIYILRDPLKRLWSHVKFHQQFAGKGNSFLNWNESDHSSFLNQKFIYENSTYSEYISRMASSLDQSEFKYFYLEDMLNSPSNKLRELEAFLGISHLKYSPENLNKKVNASADLEMPKAFIKAGEKIVSKEFDNLSKIGVDIHPNWIQMQ